MKKFFLKLLTIVLVAGFAETAYQAQAVTSSTDIVQAPNEGIARATIPIVLPVDVSLVLKDQRSMTGRLTEFDSQEQTLQISRERDSHTVQIAQVQQLNFRRDALVYDSKGEIVIRGDDAAVAEQRTWENIPLQAFELKDPELGQAQVILADAIDPIQLRGILMIAKQSLYVVDEIQFQPAGKMTMKVTPTDR